MRRPRYDLMPKEGEEAQGSPEANEPEILLPGEGKPYTPTKTVLQLKAPVVLTSSPTYSEFMDRRIFPDLPKRKPTRMDQIRRLAIVGCDADEIKFVLGLTDKEFGPYMRIMDRGKAMRRAIIRQRQFQIAMRGNPTMLIWLGKQYLGQRDEPGPPDETLGALGALIDAIKQGPKPTISTNSQGDE